MPGLPRQLRAKIAGKRGIFDYTKRLAGYGRETDREISEEAKRLTPPVTHALVRAHPETGDRSLYLDSTTTIGIDYMDTTSGLALLDEVYENATRDEFVYAHQWQVGDLVLWDNGVTMHRRTPVRPRREAADEADDDAARPLSPCDPERQARPIRGRNADLNA